MSKETGQSLVARSTMSLSLQLKLPVKIFFTLDSCFTGNHQDHYRIRFTVIKK